MNRNPLLTKEFRQRMRTRRAPVIITGYVLVFGVITFFLLYENVQGQLALLLPARSQQVFLVLTLLQMTVVAFLTPAFAAGAISGERERKTLAVLLTTPLSPVRILVGKILSSSALLALLVVVTLPLYSLVFLFGGAVIQEALAVFSFQLVTIVLIATLSVLWSSIALRSGWSTVLAYGTVSWMMILTGLIGYALKLLSPQSPIEFFALHWANIILSLNPLWMQASLEAVVTAGTSNWIGFSVFYIGLCLVLAVPATLRLRPQWVHKIPWLRGTQEGNYQ
ncbi:ABC transporter permease [Alicyclobacillus sp. SO9]|uniref:ABC transporter permease n=1 Tax=Alicyclobacillus sp. SO9 TaxID=2665646 RepID=UPI0018E7867E|nr:ABC transporter permease subunit [Alicyclobacillus sp. SO9]QQE77385.1 ABC transporter permease subunit [Alicyclobacillus sp. SO9]